MVFLFTSIDHPELFDQRGTPEADQVLASQLFRIEEILHRQGAHWTRRTDSGVLAAFGGGAPPDPGAGSLSGGPGEAALALLKEFQDRSWEGFGRSALRVALHAGEEAEPQGQNYVGPDVNHTLALLDSAGGGGALLTVPAVHFVPLPAGARLKDLGPHFLKDLSGPGNLFFLQHPDLREHGTPAVRSLGGYRQNLSPQASPFFGREEEKGEIADFLARSSGRLLTLAGPGGFGKTRLALQAAAGAVEGFPDGVYVVALAPLLSDHLMVGSIASAIGFFFFGSEDPKVQLLNHLRSKEMLLVMDNFEHIIEGAQLVSEILEAAPKVKIVATSRERLRVAGEKVFEVKGLRYPRDAQSREFESSGAVQLFLKGARKVRPGFTLSPDDREPLLGICRLLEGMPLGLELAATWVGSLGLPEIRDKIEKSRDFLATSFPHLPPRHRSLRAVFEYSWILLSEGQKSVLKGVSVFKGGFTEQAASRVAGASGGQLDYLENKSLLRRRPDGRFEIHELLKYYAKEKLFDDAAEKERTLDAHCAYFAGLLARRRSEFQGPSERTVLDELSEEMGNLREGWARAAEKVREGELRDYLDGFYLLCDIKGWYQEAKEAFRKAAEALREKYPEAVPRPEGAARLLSRVLCRWAEFEKDLGDRDRARRLYGESLELCREASLPPWGEALAGLGIVAETGGDYGSAKSWYERSLAAFRKARDRSGTTLALNHLGHIARRLGDWKGSLSLVRQSLSFSEPDGDQRAMGYSHNLLGDVLHELGRFEEARTHYQKGLAAYLESGDRRGMAWSFANLGREAEVLGDYNGARQLYKEGMTISRDLGDLRSLAWLANLLGFTAWATGDYDVARQHYEEGLFLYKEVGDRRGEAWTLDLTGSLELTQGRDQEAENHFLQSYALLAPEGLNTQNKAWHAFHLGTVAAFRGESKEASRRFKEALGLFRRMEDALGRAASLIQLGETACRQRALAASEKYFREAAAVALKSHLAPFLADLLAGVAQLFKAEGDERQAIGLLMVALSHPTCRRQTRDRAVAFSLELKSRFSPEEVEGALQWAKAARIEEVVSAWLSAKGAVRRTVRAKSRGGKRPSVRARSGASSSRKGPGRGPRGRKKRPVRSPQPKARGKSRRSNRSKRRR